MKHYVVTGGAGFIGSNLLKESRRREPGARITCIDNFDPFYPARIKEQNLAGLIDSPEFHLVKADIGKMDPQELAKQLPAKPDVIIHLAARAGVRPSIENPRAYQETNVIGLQNMLELCRITTCTQFVFASSSSVYGINDHFPWKEDEKLLPISPYAMTKLAGEMLGHVYHKLYGIRFIALRLFTVYGPGQRPDLAIHKFVKSILSGKPVTMFGDGSTSRDYTYVGDTVDGILAAAHYEGSGFEIMNLGNHYTVSLKQLIEAIEKTTGKPAMIDRQPDQPGDVPVTYADISRAQKLLGYDPQTKLEDGLKRFYEWYLGHRQVLEEK